MYRGLKYNSSGYYDKTAYCAIINVLTEERAKKMGEAVSDKLYKEDNHHEYMQDEKYGCTHSQS